MHFLSKFIRIIYPLHVSNRVTVYHQEAVNVYAVYGIYHASALKSCTITLIVLQASQTTPRNKKYLKKRKRKQRKFIFPNLPVPYNLNKQFHRIVPVHLHQHKTPNTRTTFGPSTMSKINVIQVH